VKNWLIVIVSLIVLSGDGLPLPAEEQGSFTGSATRSGPFKRPLLDVDGKRYELQASETADAAVADLLKKFSAGDTGRYLIAGARAIINGNDGIVIERIISGTASPNPGPNDSSAGQNEPGTTVAGDSGVTVVRSFPGNKGPGWKQTIDVAGAVGPDHVVDFDVAAFVVHDKVSGEILKRLSPEEFWKQVEPAGSLVPDRVANDARMLYDPLSQRWFACAAGAPEADCFLAVSTTSNPLDPWRGAKLPLPRINPYMKMGVDRNGVYVCSCNGHADPLKAMNCYVIPKSDAIAVGGPVLTNATNFPSLQFSAMPATDLDPNKHADAPAVLLTNEFSDGICDRLYLYRVTWSGLKASLSDVQIVPLSNAWLTPNNRSGLMEAVQPDPGPNLHAGGGGRRLDSAFIHNGSVFGCNGAKRTADSRLGVLWYEVRISDGRLLQEGFVDLPDRDLIYPSIAVDASGNIGIGCTGTSKTEFPSVYVMMHGANDPAGSMRSPVKAVPGTTSYHYAGKRAVNWSHYSPTCIDPTDPHLFWTLQAYGNSTVDQEWCTGWAAFRFSAGASAEN
jgi:hypothetical protein